MSFEDVDARVRDVLAKNSIALRTTEEEGLANFASLLTKNAQQEAIEYEGAHYSKVAQMHENNIKAGKDTYLEATMRADEVLSSEYIEDRGMLYKIDEAGNRKLTRDPRVDGRNVNYTRAYKNDGLQGLIEEMKNQNYSPTGLNQGNSGGSAADDVLKLQAEIVQASRGSGTAVRTAEAVVDDGARVMAKQTLKNILEGSELAAKVMRFRV
jgi:hypothetical protein